MKIVIHLEELLLAPPGERHCDPTSAVAHWILPARLRLGVRHLVRDLARTGNVLTLYSSGNRSATLIRLWCLLVGLPIQKVVLHAPHHSQGLPLTNTVWAAEGLHQLQRACLHSHEIRIVSWG